MASNARELLSRKYLGMWIFLGAALAVTLVLALLVSPWASSSPDGLDKTAQEQGFAGKAEEAPPAWGHAPMKDYAMPGVKSEKASTGLSGLIGVLVTLAVMLALGALLFFLGKRRNAKDVDATSVPTTETQGPPTA